MRTAGLWILAGLTVAGITAQVTRSAPVNMDEQEIRALEERFAKAFRARDLNGVMSVYAPGAELFVFDVTPPRQHVGFDNYKKDFQDFFAAFPGPVDKFEIQDLGIVTDGKLAYSHSIQPGIMTAKDGKKVSITVRVSDCYRKIDGKWLITQEHVSVPVHLGTGKPDLASKP